LTLKLTLFANQSEMRCGAAVSTSSGNCPRAWRKCVSAAINAKLDGVAGST
jgi:hypothetical protein